MPGRSLELNDKESLVLGSMPRPKSDVEPVELRYTTIEDIARACFSKRGTSPKTKGNSWVRNSMRKLLALGLVKHGGAKSGEYARTTVTMADVKSFAAEAELVKSVKAKEKPKAKAKAKKSSRKPAAEAQATTT